MNEADGLPAGRPAGRAALLGDLAGRNNVMVPALVVAFWAAGALLPGPVWDPARGSVAVQWQPLTLGVLGAALFTLRSWIASGTPPPGTHGWTPRTLALVAVGLLVPELAVFRLISDAAFGHWMVAAAASVGTPLLAAAARRRPVLRALIRAVVAPAAFALAASLGAAALFDGSLGQAPGSTWLGLIGVWLLATAVLIGADFEAVFQRGGGNGWALWVLTAGLGALSVAALARSEYERAVLVLAGLVAFGTILTHARTMSDRPRIEFFEGEPLRRVAGDGRSLGVGRQYEEAPWEDLTPVARERVRVLPRLAALGSLLSIFAGGVAWLL